MIHAYPTATRSYSVAALMVSTVLIACGGSAAGPDPDPGISARTIQVLFVMDTIPLDVVRIDLVVTGEGMDAVNGSVMAADGEDRVTLSIAEGTERNVFARGFDDQAQLLYMGERYFDVMAGESPLIRVPLNYKGVHFPEGAQ